jgi:hypothetical protein
MKEPQMSPAYSCAAESPDEGRIACSQHCGNDVMCPNTLTKNLSAGAGSLSGQKPWPFPEEPGTRALIDASYGQGLSKSADDNDFPLGKACDLSGEGDCEACQ